MVTFTASWPLKTWRHNCAMFVQCRDIFHRITGWHLFKWSDSRRVDCDIIMQGGIVYLSFKSTVDDVEWSDSMKVDCVHVLCRWFQHSIHNVSFKPTVNDIEWSDSRRVDSALCWCIHQNCRLAQYTIIKTHIYQKFSKKAK